MSLYAIFLLIIFYKNIDTWCCWSKTGLPASSPAKIHLYTISREPQLKVYNHEEGKEHTFIGGGGGSCEGCSQHRLCGFSKAESSPGKKGMFLLPLGLCYHCRVSELSLLVSWLLNWGFSLLIFYSVLEIFKKKLNICYFTTSGLRSTVLNNLLSSFGGAELQSVPVP